MYMIDSTKTFLSFLKGYHCAYLGNPCKCTGKVRLMISKLSYAQVKVDGEIECTQNNFDDAKDSKLDSLSECICIPSSNFNYK